MATDHPRIDIHTHVTIPAVLELSRQIKVRGETPGKQNWIPPESRAIHQAASDSIEQQLLTLPARLPDMKTMGIDIQVVSMNLPTPVQWAGGAMGAKIARALNDGIADLVATMPDRFVGVGAVALQDIKRSVRELGYIKERGLRGVQISSHVRVHDLGEEQFRPFWKAAEELGLPVIIHPRGFSHDARLHKFFLWNTIGQPLEEALAMASLIHEGIMDAYPKVKVVISHGGGYLPFYSGRGDKAFESRPEPSRHVSKPPSDYMPTFFYDTVNFEPDMLARLVRKAGVGRIMMGTDYPRGEIEYDPVGFVDRTEGLSDDDKRRIMSTNAMELFQIG